MTRVLILGATSEIAKAVARLYAARGAQLYLVGRDSSKVAALAEKLEQAEIEGGYPDSQANVQYEPIDLTDLGAQSGVLDRAWKAFAGFDRALIAYGVLPDEIRTQSDWREAQQCLMVNLVSVVTLLDRLVEQAGRPSDMRIGVIGSVAGDRGRDRVGIYSAAKGGLERYTEALQQRTWPDGPQVVLLKPGWVRSPMTSHMPPSALITPPERAASAIVSALDSGKRSAYIPSWWRVVMLMVRSTPSFLFNRMKF